MSMASASAAISARRPLCPPAFAPAAHSDLIMTLDADLQDDPAEIPRLPRQARRKGYDVVSGWKETRLDPWHKTFWPSRVFNGMVSWLTGVKLITGCGMKCYRAEIFREVRLYGELHPLHPGAAGRAH